MGLSFLMSTLLLFEKYLVLIASALKSAALCNKCVVITIINWGLGQTDALPNERRPTGNKNNAQNAQHER